MFNREGTAIAIGHFIYIYLHCCATVTVTVVLHFEHVIPIKITVGSRLGLRLGPFQDLGRFKD